MKTITRRLALSAMSAALMALTLPAMAQGNNKVVLGVAIPSATHGFTGGIVYWANQAKKDLEKANPNLQVIVKTASGAPEQANQLQDMVTVNKINALVIFPFESAALTKPVAQVKAKGVYVTVVDRGLCGRRQHGIRQAAGRIPGQAAGWQGQYRGYARHRHHAR
jgi:ribose transport system substrate-binding protein